MKPEIETIEQARSRRYGKWAGSPNGRPYIEGDCAYEVFSSDGWMFYQCTRKNGHGPGGLYCKQHAKKFETP